MIVLKLIALFAVMVFAGWAAASILDRGGIDGWGKIYLALTLGTSLVSLEALLLASLGALGLTNLLMLMIFPALILAYLAGERLRTCRGIRMRQAILVLFIIFIVGLVISPPSRIIYGWSDVGIYPNIAAHMAREGRILIEDSLVPQVDPENRDLVFRPNADPEVPIEAYQNKALFITDFEKGEITPQFLYLWPSLMAVFSLFLGLENMFWAITWVSLLALAGLFLLARRWLGIKWAFIVAFLALISPLYLYFSRYTSSEMMNAVFILAAAFCHSVYVEANHWSRKEEAVGMAVASAFFLCLGFLCRVDFFLVLFPILIFYLFKNLYSGLHAADWCFFLLSLFGGVLCAVADYALSRPYFVRTTNAYRELFEFFVHFPGVFVPLAYAALIVSGKWFRRQITVCLEKNVQVAKNVMIAFTYAVLCVFLCYLVFLRPLEPQTYASYGEVNAIMGPTYNNETILRWAWYFSWLGIAAMFIGYVLFVFFKRNFTCRLIAAIGLTFTIVYSLSLHCTPMHINAMRRLVPVVLPLGLIMIVYTIKTISGFLVQMKYRKIFRWAGWIAGTGAVLYLAAFFIFASQPIFGLQEGGNQYQFFKEMAEIVPSRGVIIMDHHAGDICGPPLKCFFGVENLWLVDNSTLGEKEFASLLRDLDFPQRPVYILWRPETKIISIPLQEGLRYDLVKRLFWRERLLEQSFVSRPAKPIFKLEAFEIYRISELCGS